MIIDGFEHGRPYTHAYTPTHWGIIMALSDHSWVQDELEEGGGGGRGEVGLVFGFGFRVFVIFYRAGKRVE